MKISIDNSNRLFFSTDADQERVMRFKDHNTEIMVNVKLVKLQKNYFLDIKLGWEHEGNVVSFLIVLIYYIINVIK